jgi:hypothetical protein
MFCNRRESKPLNAEVVMLSKFNSLSVFILALAVLLLLVIGFSASVVLADGQGGQWPVDPPPPTTGGDDGGEGEGVQTLVTVMTLMELIL